MMLTETLQDLRRLQAKTQPDLGDQSTISRIERGQVRASPETMRHIAEVLALPIERVVAACDECYRRHHIDPTPILGHAVVPAHAPGHTDQDHA